MYMYSVRVEHPSEFQAMLDTSLMCLQEYWPNAEAFFYPLNIIVDNNSIVSTFGISTTHYTYNQWMELAQTFLQERNTNEQ